jgi:hypothetical protein
VYIYVYVHLCISYIQSTSLKLDEMEDQAFAATLRAQKSGSLLMRMRGEGTTEITGSADIPIYIIGMLRVYACSRVCVMSVCEYVTHGYVSMGGEVIRYKTCEDMSCIIHTHTPFHCTGWVTEHALSIGVNKAMKASLLAHFVKEEPVSEPAAIKSEPAVKQEEAKETETTAMDVDKPTVKTE